MKEKPNYYAILPANVRYDDKLKPSEKLLFAEITALSNKHGFCWSTNNYFAELYDVTKVTVSTWISNLVNNGYLQREVIYKKDTKEVLKRKLIPIKENINTPIKEKIKGNTTRFNTTRNNKESALNFEENSKQVKAALKLRNYIKQNIPKQPVPDKDVESMQEWALSMDRLNRIGTQGGNEGFTWQEIDELIEYSQNHDFWYSNILSPSKLRKQSVRLFEEMKNENEGVGQTDSEVVYG